MAQKKCKGCQGTGKAWSVYFKAFVVCDACMGSGEA